MADEVKLKKFENKDVVGTSIKVTRAGDGLSSALDVDPIAIPQGAKVYLILETECIDVQHPRAKANNANLLMRKHVLQTSRAMIVDGSTVAATLDERDRVLAERAEEARVREADRLAEQGEAGR